MDNIRFAFDNNLIFIVGNYGSGKTEVAVNLALVLRREGAEVAIADLDVVNPYFRCRDPRDQMAAAGIRVVIPPGNQRFADLPIIVPEIRGMMQAAAQRGHFSIFDIGGDDVGATILASFEETLADRPYALLQVINSRRPFTDSVKGCMAMMRGIERTSKLKVTGLVVNTHLMEETSAEVVAEGYMLAREVSAESGVPIAFLAVEARLVSHLALHDIDAPVLCIERIMVPPWLQGPSKGVTAWFGQGAVSPYRAEDISRS